MVVFGVSQSSKVAWLSSLHLGWVSGTGLLSQSTCGHVTNVIWFCTPNGCVLEIFGSYGMMFSHLWSAVLKTYVLLSFLSLMPRRSRLKTMSPRTQRLASLSLVIQLVGWFRGGTMHFLPRLKISSRIPILSTWPSNIRLVYIMAHHSLLRSKENTLVGSLVGPTSRIDCMQLFYGGSFFVLTQVFVYCLFSVETRVDNNSPHVAVPATAIVWTLEFLIRFWKFLVSNWRYFSQSWIFCQCDS